MGKTMQASKVFTKLSQTFQSTPSRLWGVPLSVVHGRPVQNAWLGLHDTDQQVVDVALEILDVLIFADQLGFVLYHHTEQLLEGMQNKYHKNLH